MCMMATDSVPALICQLSTLHLDQALKNYATVWSHEQKQHKQKKLKSLAFETVFHYLQDHGIAKSVYRAYMLLFIVALLFCSV